jgi:aerobic carbon-monoxide dehydrogenase medium subunit
VKPAPFDYHAPDTVDEAVALLAELGEGAKVLAGGQSLIPILALRLGQFGHLVDVGRVAGLGGSELADGVLAVRAATRQAHIERDRAVWESVPLLAEATGLIGHFQIRNRGTVGGSLAHADPAAEYPAVAVALDATFQATSVRGTRQISAEDFFVSTLMSALEPDEMLVEVRFPVWGPGCGFAVEEVSRRAGDFAVAGAAVGIRVGDSRVETVRAAFLAMATTPVRATEAERALTGLTIEEMTPAVLAAAGWEAAAACDPPADIHADAAYRRKVGAVALERALGRAVARATAARTAVVGR